MNNNIDFSDFNKITVEHNSRCRKITKHKFTILSILNIIIIIILIIVYINKNKQIEQNNIQLSDIKNKISLKKLAIENIKQQLTKSNNTLSSYKHTEKLISEYNLKKQILDKNSLKNTLIERLNKIGIDSSNVHKNIAKFESMTSTQVKDKCYDSIVYGFNPQKFHQNCDGHALLFLIKTDGNQNIGAYTSSSSIVKENIQEKDSILMNFDNDKYYIYTSDNQVECYTSYSDYNFPLFGDDLIIKNNGYGSTQFPFCYGDKEGNNEYLVNNKYFYIEILEIYKVEAI